MRLAKNIVVFVLILNTIGSVLLVPLIYLDFSLRRDYIAKVLCINRKKPITVCHGKCYLKGRLEIAKQQQEKKQANQQEQRLDFSFFRELSTKEIAFEHRFFFKDPNQPVVHPNPLPRSFIADIFRPPQLA